MHRFGLLSYYVAGVVAVIVLAVAAAATWRAAPGSQESGAEAPSDGTAAPPAAKVSIENFAFEPKELVVTAGTTVAWVNADDAPHTATSTASPPLFDSKTLKTGGTFSFEFKAPGTYEYFCKLHPYMTGKVIVR